MQYPLHISFKIVALAPQMSVTDSSSNLLLYVRQKLFKLKEEVKVFADQEQTQLLYTINADRVIDFSARYSFSDPEGTPLGAVKRQGVQSLWRARYDIFSPGSDIPSFSIQEENPFVKVADGCLNSIPIISMFSGYFFHPAYIVSRQETHPVMRLQKEPAFFEGKFKIEKLAELDQQEEQQIILSLLMMTLLERARG